MFNSVTPVPWRKSCRWHIKDLFICTGLILKSSRSKISDKNVDSKCKIKQSDILCHKTLKDARRIVVEGEPGSGKTMLSYSLANDWAEDKLNEIDILVLLPLKFVKERTIPQSVKEFYVSDEDSVLSEKDVELILCSSEYRCCVILDGVEEYTGGSSVTDRETSELTKVMRMEKLQSCKVIATARSDYFQNFPDCPILKIVGFGDSDRKDYVERMFPENKAKQQDVIRKITDNPLLLEICSVPLMFVLVVHNIEVHQRNECKNLTGLIQNILREICRLGSTRDLMSECETSAHLPTSELFNLESSDSDSDLEEFNDILSKYNIDSGFLSRIAFDGLCRSNQQLLWKKEYFEMYDFEVKDAIECGILISEEGMETSRKTGTLQASNEIVRNEEAGSQFIKEEFLQQNKPVYRLGIEGLLERKPTSLGKETQAEKKVTQSEGMNDGQNNKFSEILAQKMQREIDKVPLQLRFLHKVIQEYFAASYMVSTQLFTEDDELETSLYSIDPVDLHHVFRFACGQDSILAPSIMRHLLDRYRRLKDRTRALATLNCLFLCFEEYDEDISTVKELVWEICQETISIDQGDSRMLQKSKVRLLEFASNFEIPIRKLHLNDVVTHSIDMNIILDAEVTLHPLTTLEEIVVSQWDHRLTEKDYLNILKFITRSRTMCEARFHLPSTPPVLDTETIQELSKGNPRVVWKVGYFLEHTLDTISGKWELSNLKKEDIKEKEKGDYTIIQEPHYYCELEKKAKVSKDGGTIGIQGTGVELYIPPNALHDDTGACIIQIKIIPHSSVGEPAQSFAGNSSIIVELLPNRLSLQCPVRLTLPHCLQLKRETPRKAKVFISHHEIGFQPCWRELTADDPTQVYKLDETSCSIWLQSFCWVKYEVGDEIVEGKKIVIYTARKKLSYEDNVAQVDVGYYPQLSGEGEIFRLNKDIIVAEKMPLLFLKEGKKPLQIYFEKSVPGIWCYPKTEENPMEISFRSIALSDERCLPFLLEKRQDVCDDSTSVPTCLFKAWQDENEKIHLTIRLEVEKEQQTSDDNPITTKGKALDVGGKTYRRQSQETTHEIDTATGSQEFRVRSLEIANTERSSSNFGLEASYSPPPVSPYPSSPFFSRNDNEGRLEEAIDGKGAMAQEECLGAVGGRVPQRRPSQPMEALNERFQRLQTTEELPDNQTYEKMIMLPLKQSHTGPNYPVQHQYYNISQVYYGSSSHMRPPTLLTSEGGPHPSNMFSLSFKTMNTIANRLDGPDVLGNNWQRLADVLNFNLDQVLAFQRCESPTQALITTAIRMGKLNSLNQLRDILKKIEREDAAAAVPYEGDQNNNSNQID